MTVVQRNFKNVMSDSCSCPSEPPAIHYEPHDPICHSFLRIGHGDDVDVTFFLLFSDKFRALAFFFLQSSKSDKSNLSHVSCRAEINIKPWDNLLKEVKEGNRRSKWIEREPYAYWKGNPFVADTRKDLLTCNVSDNRDWNARLFIQDWILESQQGFNKSDLASQCTYRYKIYIEGYAWSVSEKYILACDSPTLLVKPHYHDFFTRSLQPVEHYWPIRDNGKCKSIKFAVDWGNRHKQKAHSIGKAASDFIQEELKMDYVYDYMFHLLNEYAKLLNFEPQVPEGAVELCSETMACPADGRERKFMMESLVKSPSTTSPCSMPPPYEPHILASFYRRKLNAMRQVEKWEDAYWESFSKKQ